MRLALFYSCALLASLAGCVDEPGAPPQGAGAGGSSAGSTAVGMGGSGVAAGGLDSCDSAPTRAVSCVLSFTPGPGAGFGQEDFPEIVYGPPEGGGLKQGSLDVLSLGRGGEIIVGFGTNRVIDGPGADLIVFENAFAVSGDETVPFKELGEVAVSEDGETWVAFPCSTEVYPFEGCAGWRPVYSSADSGISPYDPAASGGEAFDLADLGLESARYVRIRDLGKIAAAPNAGFDLDAVTIVHDEAGLGP